MPFDPFTDASATAFEEFDPFAGEERFEMEPGMVFPSQVPHGTISEPSRFLDRFALTLVGEFLGIGRGRERELQRETGGAAAVMPQDILNTGFQFLTVPPQIAEPYRELTDITTSVLPAPVAGLQRGIRDVALG